MDIKRIFEEFQRASTSAEIREIKEKLIFEEVQRARASTSADIRNKFVFEAIQRANASTGPNIRNIGIERHEFICLKLKKDSSITVYETMYALSIVNRDYDYFKVSRNKGEKRLCENCSLESLATTYCENCIRINLINNFPNWTSGDDNVDYLIQACQKEVTRPDHVIGWIPYNKLQNIEYLTKGGFSEIYKATWTEGRYDWDDKKQQLMGTRGFEVILKKLENVEKADRRWFDEAKIHLTLCNKHLELVTCYGLTKDPKDGKYMLVMRHMDTDLRKYMEKKRTWKEKLIIANDIIKALLTIHYEEAIHRDLHSGNILYSEFNGHWYLSDFGLCGPADKPLNSIYGNLPYIAPEVLRGREYTSASDIYSFGILMSEIASGQAPFKNVEHNYHLTMEICEGERPKIRKGIPSKYKELMQQCWDADPLKRPDGNAINDIIEKMRDDSYKNDDTNEFNTLEQEEQDNSSQISSSSSDLGSSCSSCSSSKLHHSISSISNKIYDENYEESRNSTGSTDEHEAFRI